MKTENKSYVLQLLVMLMFFMLPTVSFAECTKGDCFNGEGTMIIADGIKYIGQWKDGLRHGRGLMTFSDGRKYLGDWENDRPNGSGTMSFSDGGKYEGQFKNGLRQGQGTFSIPDGRNYIGEWQDDKPHGQGIMTFSDGHRYEGSWVKSFPQGQGVMNYPDGSLFEGSFVEGVRHGTGVIIMSDGIRYEGTWEDDSPKGEAIIIYSDEERSPGYWHNGEFVKSSETQAARPDRQPVEQAASPLVTASGGDDVLPDNVEKAIEQMSFSGTVAGQSEDRTPTADIPGLFPQASIRKLTEADLLGKSLWELSVVRNEIFARHSYIFKTEPMRKYFSKQPWYKPRFKNVFPRLADLEKLNIVFILDFQKRAPVLNPTKERKKDNAFMAKVFASVNGDKVNIRSGPGKKNKAIITVATGYPLGVIEHQGAWARVEDFSAQKGWIFSSLLSDIKTVIVKVDSANIRTGPGTNFEVAVKAARGTILRYSGREGDWLKVSSDRFTRAWVYEDLVWPGDFGRQ